MKPSCRFAKICTALIIFCLTLFSIKCYASFDASAVINNIVQGDKQSVLSGKIDCLTIIRGKAEFRLGAGDVTLYDFGSGKIAALTFKGTGRFVFHPPNDVELGQLRKFTKQDSLDESFKQITLFFTVSLDNLPDTSSFTRVVVSADSWGQLDDSRDEIFDHLKLNISSNIMGDLLSEKAGTFFCVRLVLDNVGDVVFLENPYNDDQYQLIQLVKYLGSNTYDIVSGYSGDGKLVSERGIIPVDITNYKIDYSFDGDQTITAKSRIYFTPLLSGRQYIYFTWYYKNKILSAFDSDGDSLLVIRRIDNSGLISAKVDEPGFGIILRKPMEIGDSDFVDIEYECKGLENTYGNIYLKDKAELYPAAPYRDLATFELSFDTPKAYEAVACGDNTKTSVNEGRRLSNWKMNQPVDYISFDIGDFESRQFTPKDLPAVEIFTSKTIPHDSLSLILLKYYGIASTADMLGTLGADVTNSLAFYTSIFGPCPYDTLRAAELFSTNEGLGSPGLIHLSWETFQWEDIGGSDIIFRAHEVAHQWWGLNVGIENYHDMWIAEGLAEYCGYWFYQMSTKNTKVCKDITDHWRQYIATGTGMHSKGSSAGPVVMGSRLTSTKSEDVNAVVYDKGAYIFHMIRYLLHDFKTNSDDAFGEFLKDLATEYKGKTITTASLQKLLEEQVGEEMTWFFKQWVYGTAIPEYDFSSKSSANLDGSYKVICHVKQKNVPSDFKMLVPLTVLFDDDKYIHLRVWVDQPEKDIELPALPYKPKKIIFNSYDAVMCDVKYY